MCLSRSRFSLREQWREDSTLGEGGHDRDHWSRPRRGHGISKSEDFIFYILLFVCISLGFVLIILFSFIRNYIREIELGFWISLFTQELGGKSENAPPSFHRSFHQFGSFFHHLPLLFISFCGYV